MAILEVKDPARRGLGIGERFLVEWEYSDGFKSGFLRPPDIVGKMSETLNSRPCITVEDTEAVASVSFGFGFVPFPIQKVRTTIIVGCSLPATFTLTMALQPVFQTSNNFWSLSRVWLLTSGESSDVEQVMNANPQEFPKHETAQSAIRESAEKVGGSVADTGGAILEGAEQVVRNPVTVLVLTAAIIGTVLVLTRT